MRTKTIIRNGLPLHLPIFIQTLYIYLIPTLFKLDVIKICLQINELLMFGFTIHFSTFLYTSTSVL